MVNCVPFASVSSIRIILHSILGDALIETVGYNTTSAVMSIIKHTASLSCPWVGILIRSLFLSTLIQACLFYNTTVLQLEAQVSIDLQLTVCQIISPRLLTLSSILHRKWHDQLPTYEICTSHLISGFEVLSLFEIRTISLSCLPSVRLFFKIHHNSLLL